MAVSPLVIRIGADVTGASRAIGALETEIKGVGETMNTAQAGISSAIGTIGQMAAGFVAAQVFEKWSESIAEVITHTQDLGNATYQLQSIVGGTTQSASALLAVFERYGVNVDQASTSLGIFSKHLAGIEDLSDGAALGSKSFNQTMRDLGVSFTSASGAALPMNQVLLNVADRFQTMGPGADRTAIALQLFGRSGKDLIPVLSLGAAGMQEAEDAAAKYGLTLSGANVQAIRDYGFAHKDLDEAMQGVTLTVGTMLIPAMTHIAQSAVIGAQALNQTLIPALKDAASEAQRMREIVDLAQGKAAATAPGVTGKTGLGEPTILKSADALLGYATAGATALGVITGLGGAIGVTVLETELLGKAFGYTGPQAQLLADKMDAVQGYMGGLNLRTAEGSGTVQHLGDTMGAVAQDAAELGNKLIYDQQALIAFTQQVAAMRSAAAADMARDPNAGRPLFNLEGPSSNVSRASTEQGLLQSNLAATEKAAIKAGKAATAAFRPFADQISVIDARIAGIQIGPLEKQLARLEKRPLDPRRPTSELPRLEIERRILELRQTMAAGKLGGGGATAITIHGPLVQTGPITGAGDENAVADKVFDALLTSGKTANTANKRLPGA